MTNFPMIDNLSRLLSYFILSADRIVVSYITFTLPVAINSPDSLL